MSMKRTDEALMLAVREGDLDQLEILYQRYRDPLYDFFSRLTGNRVASDDLVHDVFVRILKYRETYQEANRFVTWMYQIARNARTDYLRKHSEVPLEEFRTAESAHDIKTPGRQHEENEEKELLQCALTHLPESSRELLILARFQEMEYEDVAQLYGISLGAVRTRVYRAVKELREHYLHLRGNRSSCNATKSVTTSPTA